MTLSIRSALSLVRQRSVSERGESEDNDPIRSHHIVVVRSEGRCGSHEWAMRRPPAVVNSRSDFIVQAVTMMHDRCETFVQK